MITISREIGIDAGHRVPDHLSKCRSPHGHRYKIILTVSGDLKPQGAEKGMVKDFSFLKQVMMDEIDQYFDHAMIISIYDEMMMAAYGYDSSVFVDLINMFNFEPRRQITNPNPLSEGFDLSGRVPLQGKHVLVPFSPTAENLAAHWGRNCQLAISDIDPDVQVDCMEVWETPNCCATWVPEEGEIE